MRSCRDARDAFASYETRQSRPLVPGASGFSAGDAKTGVFGMVATMTVHCLQSGATTAVTGKRWQSLRWSQRELCQRAGGRSLGGNFQEVLFPLTCSRSSPKIDQKRCRSLLAKQKAASVVVVSFVWTKSRRKREGRTCGLITSLVIHAIYRNATTVLKRKMIFSAASSVTRRIAVNAPMTPGVLAVT